MALICEAAAIEMELSAKLLPPTVPPTVIKPAPAAPDTMPTPLEVPLNVPKIVAAVLVMDKVELALNVPAPLNVKLPALPETLLSVSVTPDAIVKGFVIDSAVVPKASSVLFPVTFNAVAVILVPIGPLVMLPILLLPNAKVPLLNVVIPV